MQSQFIECKSRATAKRQCPWAAVIARAEGGYWCFAYRSDYRVWRNQH